MGQAYPVLGLVRRILSVGGAVLLMLALHMGRMEAMPAPCMSVAVMHDSAWGYHLVWEGGQERLTKLPDDSRLTFDHWLPDSKRLILRTSSQRAYMVDVGSQQVTTLVNEPLDTTLLYNWGGNPDKRVVMRVGAGRSRSYEVVTSDGRRTPLLMDIETEPVNIAGDADYLTFSLKDGSLVWMEARTGKVWQVYPSYSFPTKVWRSADGRWGLLVGATGKDTRGNTLYSMERLNLRDGTLQTAPQPLPLPIIGFSPTGAYALLQRGNGIMPYSWAQQGLLQAARPNPQMPDDFTLLGWLNVNTVLLRLERAAPFRVARVDVLTGWTHIYPLSFDSATWLPATQSLLLVGDERYLYHFAVDSETLTPLTQFVAASRNIQPAGCGDAYILTNPTRWGTTDRPETRMFAYNPAMLGWIEMSAVEWGMPSLRLMVGGVLMLGVGVALGHWRR